VTPPRTAATFDAYLERLRKPAHIGYWVRTGDGELAGVISASEIVRGVFQSAYLGYYAFSPHNGQGHMNCGLRAVLGDCSECIGCIASKRTFSLVMPPRGGWFAASDSGWKAFHRGTWRFAVAGVITSAGHSRWKTGAVWTHPSGIRCGGLRRLGESAERNRSGAFLTRSFLWRSQP